MRRASHDSAFASSTMRVHARHDGLLDSGWSHMLRENFRASRQGLSALPLALAIN